MSLSSSLTTYQHDIKGIFATTSNSYTDTADGITSKTKSWAIQGVPMTQDSGASPIYGLAGNQAVAAFLTSTIGNVTGTAVGGIDTTTEGGGLSGAKTDLVHSLTSAFSTLSNSADSAATDFTNAVNTFLSAAKIMATITATIPIGVAVSATPGPVGTGSYSGTGSGGIDSSTAGAGITDTASISALEVALITVFSTTSNTANDAAKGIADALDTYFLTANISTVESGTAGGGTATVDATSGNGTTDSSGSPIISGGSTSGTIS